MIQDPEIICGVFNDIQIVYTLPCLDQAQEVEHPVKNAFICFPTNADPVTVTFYQEALVTCLGTFIFVNSFLTARSSQVPAIIPP